jgi:polyhydroxyalkanoate synthesis regulator phasin
MENIIKNVVYSTLGMFSSNVERGQKLVEQFQRTQKRQREEGRKIVNEFLSKASNQEITSLDFLARYEITDSKYLLPNS